MWVRYELWLPRVGVALVPTCHNLGPVWAAKVYTHDTPRSERRGIEEGLLRPKATIGSPIIIRMQCVKVELTLSLGSALTLRIWKDLLLQHSTSLKIYFVAGERRVCIPMIFGPTVTLCLVQLNIHVVTGSIDGCFSFQVKHYLSSSRTECVSKMTKVEVIQLD